MAIQMHRMADSRIPIEVPKINTSGVAIDTATGKIYWANNGSGEILSAPIGGGKTVALATGQLQPQAMAVDTKNLYWANSDSVAGGMNGSVMQLELTK